mgnify:FL=1
MDSQHLVATAANPDGSIAMARIELHHLRTLVALRDTGTLVEAADRLCLTQSALSHQVKDVEDRLRCSLFMRKTRPVRFTSAGQRLLALADDILPQIRAAEIDLDRLAGGETGRLSLALECHSCFQWLMPTIDRFRHHWPDVELDLSCSFSFAPLQALARGDLDLVIGSDPLELPGVHYEPLFRYEVRLARRASARYLVPVPLPDTRSSVARGHNHHTGQARASTRNDERTEAR